jgi:uncharacterized OB-fold protein
MDAPTPLHFQRCSSCGSAVHPPRPMCPVCGSVALAFEESAGEGTVYSSSTVHAREGAYDVSLVDLDEGYRVMTTVTGGGVIGARVHGRVEDADDGPRLVFDP